MSGHRPMDHAIWLLKKEGCFGAKQATRRMLEGRTSYGEAHWQEVLAILEDLNPRLTREALVKHLQFHDPAASPNIQGDATNG